LAQLFQGALPTTLLFGRRTSRSQRDRRLWRRLSNQTDPADVEVFFEAIQLEEIGELEGADVAAGVADFLLQIADDLGEVGQRKAGVEEIPPGPCAWRIRKMNGRNAYPAALAAL